MDTTIYNIGLKILTVYDNSLLTDKSDCTVGVHHEMVIRTTNLQIFTTKHLLINTFAPCNIPESNVFGSCLAGRAFLRSSQQLNYNQTLLQSFTAFQKSPTFKKHCLENSLQ